MAETNRRSKDAQPAEESNPLENLSFRRRALVEAARYGSDPWVFVRELLQNARDAGARQVVFETVVGEGKTTVTCRDDGVGMTYAHAQRYLFALYASSKEEEETQAGQFGIGFWSLLRFRPSSITVRSRTLEGTAWEVVLDGDLEHVRIEEETEISLSCGTEIVVERAIDHEVVGDQVLRAARHHGRFLTQRPGAGRGRGEQELEVMVDGRRINEPFTLPSPSAAFRGRGFRGVVALGHEPSVELFAHGLFVRSAQSLEELLDGEPRRKGESTEDALAELPSLAPQILLDSDELELLLARSDARQNRHLTQLVRRAEKELSRLVQQKLDALSPQPWYRVWLGTLRERLEFLKGRTLAAALLIGVVVGSLLGLGVANLWSASSLEWLAADGPRQADQEVSPETPWSPGGDVTTEEGLPSLGDGTTDGLSQLGETSSGAPASVTARGGSPAPQSQADSSPVLRPYRDLAASYRGPRVDPEEPPGSPRTFPALEYHPAAEGLLFNALVVDDLASGRPAQVESSDTVPYRPTPCRGSCLGVRMLVQAEAGLLRLPVPTGHRLSTATVRLNGAEFPVFETPQGEAVLHISSAVGGRLEYQTGPAPAPEINFRSLPQTPSQLLTEAAKLNRRPRAEQIAGALEYVSERVVYSRSREVVQAFAKAQSRTGTFLQAALEVGAGDCDVQNGVLTALLTELGWEARMVLGYVGHQGLVAPGLHAWVEVRADDGRWQAIDASLETPVHPLHGSAQRAGGPEDSLFDGRAQAARAGESAGWPPAADRQRLSSPWWRSWWLLLGGILLALSIAWFFRTQRRREKKSAFDLGEEGDLAALLGGALRHPTAFAAMPAVFHGRFVPLLGQSAALSLHQARRLAEERRLFRSDQGSELARRAAGKGISVVDGGTPEGAVLSRAFGAIDLDHWGDLLARCHETESTRRIGERLGRLGETWRIKEAPDLPEAAVEIALEDLRLGHRLVLIDLEHPDLAGVRPGAETAQDDFTLLDVLAPRLEFEPGDQARVLSHFAAAALEEAVTLEATP